VGYGREGLPVVDTRKVTTTVRVKYGQTITIGGLTQENTRKVQNKIPILGHIPILGYLFSHTEYEKQKTDIVIFITPRIKKEWNPDQ
jgi:type II secretory pathway component GspD/PulD (secretin)